ncbi:TIM barrel protein [Aerococcaceae bacterium DSM 111020]|nr:TIM barrel protein [Aerococcaceae bacterium DSM 111020]
MIGLCSVTFRHLSIDEIFKLAKDMELDAIEWGSDIHVRPGDFDTALLIKNRSQELGISYTSYGSYYFLHESQNFDQILETAHAMNAKTIRLWAGKVSSEEASDRYRQALISEAKQLANIAQEKNIHIALEYHSGTLTDTPESAHRLIGEINHPNVSLYWQPAENLTVPERLSSLKCLMNDISNIHVFHWRDFNHRYSLALGRKEWLKYLNFLGNNEHVYYLEFVKDDSIEQFKEDIMTLRSWLGELM